MEAINLDLLPGAMPPIVHVSQGDVGRQFKISIYDDTGAAYSLTGKTLSIVGHKGDGNVFQYAIPSSAISGNMVTITTEEQMTPAAGKALCEIRIEQNGTKLGTCNFIMDVEQGPADMGSLSISALYLIDALFERAQTDIDTATAAAATATQKASEAASSATAAATSASAAATSASNAATSATNAASSANAAASSASQAASVVEGVHDDAVAAANSATAADLSATAAATSASTASTAASNASTYATAADSSADAASGYADAASQSATAAATSASNALGSASDASTAATNAANSATAASGSASDASTYASNAANSATAAAGSASDASTYATNASNSATVAASSATDAAGSASAAEDAKDAIEDMTVTAESVSSSSSAEVEKTTVQGVVNLNFKIPKGADGADGEGFKVKAQYATYADMIAAHPTGQTGDAYQVGENPTPSINNATITLTQGGVTKGSFTLNQASSATIDLDAGGSGGDVFAQTFFSRSIQIANVYSDSLCTNKLYARENGTPFTFDANTDYYLESEVIQLPGQQIFLDPIQNYWLGYFAKAGADTYNIATAYGVQLLEDFGDATSLMLLPDNSTASIVGSNNFSGITGTQNMSKSFIMPVKPANVNVNEVDGKITLKFYIVITPTTSLTWTPDQYYTDFIISCTNGQLTMAGSAREL